MMNRKPIRTCARLLPVLAVTTLIALPVAAQDSNGNSEETKGPALPEVRANSPSGMFGGKKQLAISSDAGLSISNTSIADVDGSTTTLILRPAVDYFVIDYLSIGGFLGVQYDSTSGGSTTAVSIGPRVGYNIPLSERFSIWPKVGFSFASTSQETDDVTENGVTIEGESETSTSLQLNLFAPFMFHPVQHFFIGFGPAFDLDLTGDSKATTIAARLTLGGWL